MNDFDAIVSLRSTEHGEEQAFGDPCFCHGCSPSEITDPKPVKFMWASALTEGFLNIACDDCIEDFADDPCLEA